MSQKEYASLSTLRYFLDNLKTIFAAKTEAVPDCAAADTGQFLRVVDGVAVWQSITDPEDVCIYSDSEVPDDAPEGSLWVDPDEDWDGGTTSTASDDDALDFVVSMGYVNPMIDNNSVVFTNGDNSIFIF